METIERGGVLKSPMKLGIAALAAVGLAFGAMTPAIAADYQHGPEEIIGFENGAEDDAGYNYDQWHVGSVYNTDLDSEASLEFGECSVTTLAVPADAESDASITQVLKGFPIDGRPSTVADIRAMIETISIDVESGSVTLQLPFFLQAELTGEAIEEWLGTFRNTTAFGPGVHKLGADVPLSNDTLDGGEFFGNGDNMNDVYEAMEFFTESAAAEGQLVWFELLGIGFTGSEGAVVNSITFGGNTFYFGTGDCLPITPVAPGETAPTPPKAVETARQ